MALLSRLFGGRKKSTVKSPKSYDNVPEFNPWQPVPLDSDQVTVLVYRECEQRGRRLLFDSSTVRRVSCGADHTGLIEVENDTGFRYTRQRADAKQLGEMVFGAVTMAYGGPTCKVHIIRGAEATDPACPDTLMLSRVFPMPRSAGRRARTHGSSGTSLDDSCSSTGSELSLLRLDGAGYSSPRHPRSSSMDCPPPAGRLSEDSGLSSVDSFMGPPSYLPTPYGTPLSAQGSGASLGSHGSLHRSARLRPIGSSDVMLTSRDDVTCLRMTSRTRLAVSVLVTLSGSARSVLEDTLLQHSVQLEHLLARLQQSVERGYHSRRYFVPTVYQATAAAKQDLLNLLSAPRLPRPVWLGLTSDSVTSRQRQRLADLFVSELTSLIAELDTKEHNCFISTLLTAVLTHHLHWVVTVAPRGGASGKLQPPPPARTLVVGRRTELVRRLLLVLSYFIREQLVAETMPWSFSPLRAASAGGRDASCGSLGSLRAADGRLSASSTTLRASEESGPEPPPPPPPVVSSEPGRGTLAVPASGRSVIGLTTAEAAGARSRSRFYVRLDGGHCCGGGEDEAVSPAARSRFYRPLLDGAGTARRGAETAEPLETAAECDEGYGTRTEAEEAAADSGCDAAEPAAGRAAQAVAVQPPRAAPSLIITDTSVCPPTDGSPPPTGPPAGLAPPAAVPQSRSCEPLSRPPPPPPTARRLSRSSADLRAPVRFLVGGDEEDSAAGTRRARRNSRAAAAVSESSDDDSGFAGCERCSGRPATVEPPPPPPPPPDGAGAGAGAGHTQLSRRHSDSIRDTSHYLRGYRSFRFSQPPPGRPARKARHVSDGGSPSPPVVPAPPPPPPLPPPPLGRRPCRCENGEPAMGRLLKQTALLETGRGGPGRQGLSPWASLGGGGATYVPDLALWGCDSRPAWELRLRPDLQAAAGAGGECTCVLADTDACSVQVLSSHAFPVCDGGPSGGGGLSGLAVVFAPLVSGLVESVGRVQAAGAPAGLVLHHLESQLAQLTARAAELAQFLINSSLANMQELTELMAVDSNDVPLLLSAASVLCPEVGSKYGISVR